MSLECLNLYGTKTAVEQAVAEIRRTIRISDPPGRIHTSAEWRPSESTLGPGFATIVLDQHFRIDVDVAAYDAGVTVKD